MLLLWIPLLISMFCSFQHWPLEKCSLFMHVVYSLVFCYTENYELSWCRLCRHWRHRRSLTSVAASDDKVGIMLTLPFQCIIMCGSYKTAWWIMLYELNCFEEKYGFASLYHFLTLKQACCWNLSSWACCWNLSSLKPRACFIYRVNILYADDLEIGGARASTYCTECSSVPYRMDWNLSLAELNSLWPSDTI